MDKQHKQKKKILILGNNPIETRFIHNALCKHFKVIGIIVEEKVSSFTVFKRRLKKLGFLTVMEQAVFVLFVVPILQYMYRKRFTELILNFEYKKNDSKAKTQHVDSVNDEATIKIIKEMNPTHIIVYGTRLLSKKFLGAIDVPIINIHLGMNPMYRGGNGAYWALTEDDLEHCGVTIHMIDEGIDTGGVLERVRILPTHRDSFVTYPVLQVQAGIDALIEVLQKDKFEFIDTEGEPSKLWYHPTIWQYLYFRMKGVK